MHFSRDALSSIVELRFGAGFVAYESPIFYSNAQQTDCRYSVALFNTAEEKFVEKRQLTPVTFCQRTAFNTLHSLGCLLYCAAPPFGARLFRRNAACRVSRQRVGSALARRGKPRLYTKRVKYPNQ